MVLTTRERRSITRIAWVAGIALASSTTFAEPLPASDQNPLLSGYGLPAPLPTKLNTDAAWSLHTVFAWGNSAIVESNAHESLVVDAETRELRLIAQRGLPNGFALRVHLPYRHTSAGSLDGFIDRWHDTFGLPEGARPSLPEDALRISYARDESTRLDFRSPQQGIADASIEIGKTLVAEPASNVAAWIGLKLPTGDADELTGSGSYDLTAALATEHRFGNRWTVFGQAAATWFSEGDRLKHQQRDWAWSAMAGLSVRTIGQLTLIAQLDAHSAVFNGSDVDFLGDAVMLSVGGDYRFGGGWLLSLGVTEDIAVESTTDVVFLFGLKKIF